MSKENILGFEIISKEEFDVMSEEQKDIYLAYFKDYVLTGSSTKVEHLPLEKQKLFFEYARMWLKERKYTNLTPGATTIAPKLKKVTTKIASAVIKLFADKNVIHEVEGLENIPDEICIFASGHQGLLDNFVWIPEIERHCILLHGQEVNKGLLLCQYNTGLDFVIKGDKKNNNNSKLDMSKLLLFLHSIMSYIEGTWNLSPNKLHLALSHGILDVAKKADVPVIPVAREYVYEEKNGKLVVTKIYTKYGKPIYFPIDCKLSDKLEEFSTQLSTMQFELMEKATENSKNAVKQTFEYVDEDGNIKCEEAVCFKRSDISYEEYVKYIKKSYKDLELGELDWDKETKYIFGYNPDDPFYSGISVNGNTIIGGHFINEVHVTEEGKMFEYPEQNKPRLRVRTPKRNLKNKNSNKKAS